MSGITKKRFEQPDDTYEFVHGKSLVLRAARTRGLAWMVPGMSTRVTFR
jgi:hypothetical protein